MYLEEERDDKISTLLVTSTFLDGVALSALGLENHLFDLWNCKVVLAQMKSFYSLRVSYRG